MTDDEPAEQILRTKAWQVARRAGVGVVAVSLLVGFAWVWWKGVPALYQNIPDVTPADRLKAITDTRTVLVAVSRVRLLGRARFLRV